MFIRLARRAQLLCCAVDDLRAVVRSVSDARLGLAPAGDPRFLTISSQTICGSAETPFGTSAGIDQVRSMKAAPDGMRVASRRIFRVAAFSKCAVPP